MVVVSDSACARLNGTINKFFPHATHLFSHTINLQQLPVREGGFVSTHTLLRGVFCPYLSKTKQARKLMSVAGTCRSEKVAE